MCNLVVAVAFKSREDHRKQLELEEARKAGLAPAELDEDGKEINPHIPQYMSTAPWYLNSERPVRFVTPLSAYMCLRVERARIVLRILRSFWGVLCRLKACINNLCGTDFGLSFLDLKSLKHQRNWKSDPNYTKDWYDRGKKGFQADKFRKGACTK